LRVTIFDGEGHCQLDSYETMCAVLKEIYEAAPTKWSGFVKAFETSAGPGYALELGPQPERPDRPGRFDAFMGDWVVKLRPFELGYVIKMTAEEHASAFPGGE
jgi:hypothetical protein